MPADRPVLDLINLVVSNMQATIEFYERLGVVVEPTLPSWEQHHRAVQMPDGLFFDLDSTAFATGWNGGWPAGRTGAVIGFKVRDRQTVDAIYADLIGAGHAGQQAPYDAFWGSRYAVVADPDGNSVGIMSAVDPSMASTPPSFEGQG